MVYFTLGQTDLARRLNSNGVLEDSQLGLWVWTSSVLFIEESQME